MTEMQILRAEILRRMFEDYNGPDEDQNETAQGVCAGILTFMDEMVKNRQRPKNLSAAIDDHVRSMPGVHKQEEGKTWYTGDEDNLKELAQTYYEEGFHDAQEQLPTLHNAGDAYENRRLPVYDHTLKRFVVRAEEGDYYLSEDDIYKLPKED